MTAEIRAISRPRCAECKACVQNARNLLELSQRYGSFAAYVDRFNPHESLEGLFLLKEELEARFDYLGGVTVYHLMMDLGLPVLKPDRVICRLLHRLGLLENKSQLLKAVLIGRQFAQATVLPIRYVDAILVVFGQVSATELGVHRGVCLDEPRCDVCPVRNNCEFGSNPRWRRSMLSARRG